jgi:hypothetical protein
MHSSIHNYTAAQRHADAIRAARRDPVPARPPRLRDDRAERSGLLATLTRRLPGSHALRAVPHRQ